MDKSFEQAYQEALPGHQETMAAKTADKGQRLGLIGMDDIVELQEDFCSSWPKIKNFLNMAIGAVGWWPGVSKLAAQAKAVISAIDQTVVPTVCGTKK